MLGLSDETELSNARTHLNAQLEVTFSRRTRVCFLTRRKTNETGRYRTVLRSLVATTETKRGSHDGGQGRREA